MFIDNFHFQRPKFTHPQQLVLNDIMVFLVKGRGQKRLNVLIDLIDLIGLIGDAEKHLIGHATLDKSHMA